MFIIRVSKEIVRASSPLAPSPWPLQCRVMVRALLLLSLTPLSALPTKDRVCGCPPTLTGTTALGRFPLVTLQKLRPWILLLHLQLRLPLSVDRFGLHSRPVQPKLVNRLLKLPYKLLRLGSPHVPNAECPARTSFTVGLELLLLGLVLGRPVRGPLLDLARTRCKIPLIRFASNFNTDKVCKIVGCYSVILAFGGPDTLVTRLPNMPVTSPVNVIVSVGLKLVINGAPDP